MPDRRLTEREREDLSAPPMVAADGVSVDPKMWTEAHGRVLKRAASYASVERIFVHPAIKKALCDATGKDENRAWLHKIRAYWGHHDHFHVRIACPGGSTNCEAQPPLPNDDGCGKELTNWLALVKPKPKPETPPPPGGCRQAGATQAGPHARSAAGRVPRGAGQRQRNSGGRIQARRPADAGRRPKTRAEVSHGATRTRPFRQRRAEFIPGPHRVYTEVGRPG